MCNCHTKVVAQRLCVTQCCGKSQEPSLDPKDEAVDPIFTMDVTIRSNTRRPLVRPV